MINTQSRRKLCINNYGKIVVEMEVVILLINGSGRTQCHKSNHYCPIAINATAWPFAI